MYITRMTVHANGILIGCQRGDDHAQTPGKEDAHAIATRTHVWERVAAETTVGPTTEAIRVRCVRDGANESNAYCDGITLQRLD